MKAILPATVFFLISIGFTGCGGTKETEKPKATTTTLNTAANTVPANSTTAQGDRDADDLRGANQNSANSNASNRTSKDTDDVRGPKSGVNTNRPANRKDADANGKRDDDDDNDK